MANKYDEKILSSFGKKTNDPIGNGVFVVDPNKVINNEDGIIPRYVKQEDLVMYANLTARLNPDSAIIQDDNTFKSVTIGQIGVNFMNPLKQTTKNSDGTINFAKKSNKGVFTTDWSDFFTTNTGQDGFFDPETFGITSIDVTHNAAHTPIIKIEFVDVQGRTLLERGNDPTNPYNIFYRFPYPLFTLTMKGYYGKGIEYPLSMTKTSTTFDSTTGNYIIRAEFLSRTFSIYNNFLMVYAYLAPFMYEVGDKTGNYLGTQLLKALYQKQNKKYEKQFGVTTEYVNGSWVVTNGPSDKAKNEFRKHQFTKYPSIIDMIRTSNALNTDELSFVDKLDKINQQRSAALDGYAKIDEAFNTALKTQLPEWQKKLIQDKRTPTNYYISANIATSLKSGSLANLSNQTMGAQTKFINPYALINDYAKVVEEQFKNLKETTVTNINGEKLDLKQSIFNNVKEILTATNGFINESEYLAKLDNNDIKTLFNDNLILFNSTTITEDTDIDTLNKIYFSHKFFKDVHKIIVNQFAGFFEQAETLTEDQLFFQLKEKIGFVPNIDNVIRVLMNNMQVFLTLLNLSALNSFRQIAEDKDREKIQSLFGEYEIDLDTPEIKKFYPFPNYFQKELDTNSDDFVFKKTYPGNKNTKNWFEVQFIEEIFRALKRMQDAYNGNNSIKSSNDQTLIYSENFNKGKILTNPSNQIYGLISSLLVVNNLNQYDTQQTPTETVFEFIDKLMLFTGFGTTNTEKINTKLIDMLTQHEFSMLENTLRNAEANSVSLFFTNIKNKITPTGGTETHYDAFARTMAGSGNNSVGLVNNFNNVIAEMVSLLDKQYTISELNVLKQKIETDISSATNLETFKSLYNYDPLEYKNRKNPNTPDRLHSVFFNGLNEHEKFESNDPNMIDLSKQIVDNYKQQTINTNGYYFDGYTGKIDLNEYKIDFKINNKVTTNNENSNALTTSTKTESINPSLKSQNKINSQTKYSKIII